MLNIIVSSIHGSDLEKLKAAELKKQLDKLFKEESK